MNSLLVNDDPFEAHEFTLDLDAMPRNPSLPPTATIVTTPCGDEIVSLSSLDEPTRIFDAATLDELRASINPHRRATVRQMEAVKP